MKKRYKIANLVAGRSRFPTIPHARGHIDTLLPEGDGSLRVMGWLLVPGEQLEDVEVHLDGTHLATLPLVERPDVQAAHSWLDHASRVGIDFSLPLDAEQRHKTTFLDVVARIRGERRARISQLVRADVDGFASPPEACMYRVAHTRSAHSFKVSGLKTFGDLLEPVFRNTNPAAIERLLDWGCGCGRITAHFLSIEDGPEVFGCDIDAEAVSWNREHLAQDRFAVLNPLPPTPYSDASFDLVCGYSVFTHLTRAAQAAWLGDIARILRPGGVFVATTHGPSAFIFGTGSLSASLPADGIVDSALDDTLDGIAPKDYYRSTYQSRDHTLREFGRYFEILEYVERGAMNLQDLVLMRKRS